MTNESKDSFGSRGSLSVGDRSYEIFRVGAVEGSAALPFSLKVLLENLLRTEDGANITADQIRSRPGPPPCRLTSSGNTVRVRYAK